MLVNERKDIKMLGHYTTRDKGYLADTVITTNSETKQQLLHSVFVKQKR